MILSLIYKRILSAEDLLFLMWWLLLVIVVFRFVHASVAFVFQGEHLKCFEFEAFPWVAEVFNEVTRLCIKRKIGDFKVCFLFQEGEHTQGV